MKRLTEEEIKALNEDKQEAEIIVNGMATDFGKLLLAILDKTVEDTERQWSVKGLKDIPDVDLPIWRASVRSKIQTLKGLRLQLTEAPAEFRRLEKELSQT